MEISKIIIGFVLMVGVIVLMGIGMTQMQDAYGSEVNSTLFLAYDYTSNLSLLSGEVEDGVLGGAVDESAFFPFFRIGQSFLLVTKSIQMMVNMETAFFNSFFPGTIIAPIITSLLNTIIVLLVIFAIASILWKYKV